MVPRMQSEADVAAEPGSPPTADPTDPAVVAEDALQEMKDRWLRAAADLENARKRWKREIEDARIDAKNAVLQEMLPVVDSLERAIAHATDADGPVIEGVHLVLRQFQTAFDRLQIHAIDALGTSFDPTLHEAISQQESDRPPGTVVQVLQRGYRTSERLLRPALVVVAKAR